MRRGLLILINVVCALSFAFVACKKDGPAYQIEGLVWDKSNNQPMSGVTVRVYEQFPGGQEQLKVEIGSDSDGKYNVGLSRDKYQALVLEFVKDGCFLERITKTTSVLRTDEVNKVDVNMSYESTIAIRVKNTSGTNSQVKITSSIGKTDCPMCCPAGVKTFQSATLDTTYYCANDANLPFEIFYQVGGISSGYLTKTAAPGETAEILIEY